MSVHPELEQNYNLILPTTTISSSVAPLCETSQSQAAPNLTQLRDGAENADSMEVISVINLAALLYQPLPAQEVKFWEKIVLPVIDEDFGDKKRD